jgi:hypothetical protein
MNEILEQVCRDCDRFRTLPPAIMLPHRHSRMSRLIVSKYAGIANACQSRLKVSN